MFFTNAGLTTGPRIGSVPDVKSFQDSIAQSCLHTEFKTVEACH